MNLQTVRIRTAPGRVVCMVKTLLTYLWMMLWTEGHTLPSKLLVACSGGCCCARFPAVDSHSHYCRVDQAGLFADQTGN